MGCLTGQQLRNSIRNKSLCNVCRYVFLRSYSLKPTTIFAHVHFLKQPDDRVTWIIYKFDPTSANCRPPNGKPHSLGKFVAHHVIQTINLINLELNWQDRSHGLNTFLEVTSLAFLTFVRLYCPKPCPNFVIVRTRSDKKWYSVQMYVRNCALSTCDACYQRSLHGCMLMNLNTTLFQ